MKIVVSLSITGLLLATNAPSVFGQAWEIRSHPRVGDDIEYFDLTADGRLLKIHYGRDAAREVGKIDLSGLRSALPWQGWILPDGSWVLLSLETGTKRPTFGRIYLGSPHSPLQATSFRPVLGEFEILPLSERVVLVQWTEPGNHSIVHRHRLDPSRNALIGAFDFSLHSRSFSASKGRRHYLSHALSDRITSLREAEWNQASTIEISEYVANAVPGSFFVRALSSNAVLVLHQAASNQWTKLYLLALPGLSLIAESESLERIAGRFRIFRDQPDSWRIFCIEETVGSGQILPANRAHQFVQEGARLRHESTRSFDRKSETMLWDREQNRMLKIPIHRYEYVSRIELTREVFRDLNGAPPPSLIEEAVARHRSRLETRLSEESTIEVRRLRID